MSPPFFFALSFLQMQMIILYLKRTRFRYDTTGDLGQFFLLFCLKVFTEIGKKLLFFLKALPTSQGAAPIATRYNDTYEKYAEKML